jgi:hypothetical protein
VEEVAEDGGGEVLTACVEGVAGKLEGAALQNLSSFSIAKFVDWF